MGKRVKMRRFCYVTMGEVQSMADRFVSFVLSALVVALGRNHDLLQIGHSEHPPRVVQLDPIREFNSGILRHVQVRLAESAPNVDEARRFVEIRVLHHQVCHLLH